MAGLGNRGVWSGVCGDCWVSGNVWGLIVGKHQGPVVLLVGIQWGQWWLCQVEPHGSIQVGGGEE